MDRRRGREMSQHAGDAGVRTCVLQTKEIEGWPEQKGEREGGESLLHRTSKYQRVRFEERER